MLPKFLDLLLRQYRGGLLLARGRDQGEIDRPAHDCAPANVPASRIAGGREKGTGKVNKLDLEFDAFLNRRRFLRGAGLGTYRLCAS